MRNIRFLCADIRDDSAVSGPFDFIPCYGVLSWMEEDVRRAIAGFIGRHLRADGLAAMEYMSEPGGSAFRAFHSVFRAVAGRPDPVAEGLALLEAMRDAGAGFFRLLRVELAILQGLGHGATFAASFQRAMALAAGISPDRG